MQPIIYRGLATLIAAAAGFVANAVFWSNAYGAHLDQLLTQPKGIIVALVSAVALPLIYNAKRPGLTVFASIIVLAVLYCCIWRYGFGSEGFLRTLTIMSLAYAVPAALTYWLIAPRIQRKST